MVNNLRMATVHLHGNDFVNKCIYFNHVNGNDVKITWLITKKLIIYVKNITVILLIPFHAYYISLLGVGRKRPCSSKVKSKGKIKFEPHDKFWIQIFVTSHNCTYIIVDHMLLLTSFINIPHLIRLMILVGFFFKNIKTTDLFCITYFIYSLQHMALKRLKKVITSHYQNYFLTKLYIIFFYI